jgi:hypothetical protein
MAKQFYPQSDLYPDMMTMMMERIRYYIFQLLYAPAGLDFNTEKEKRFIIANFESSSDVAIRRSIEQNVAGGNTFGTQSTFPFTAYNIGDEEPVEYFTYYQKSNRYFDTELNCYVTAVPYSRTIPMVSFFNTAVDYERANVILTSDVATLARLIVPCMVNGNLNSFTVDVQMDADKGSYAYEFEEYLRSGRIWDINHTMTLKYNHIILAQPSFMDASGMQTARRVYPVDDIILSLYEIDQNNIPKLQTRVHCPENPKVNSTAPINGETNFDKTAPIIINFSKAMNESLTLSNIDIVPAITSTKVFDQLSVQLVIDPTEALQANTTYTIMINHKAESGDGAQLATDFTLSFTTGN